MSAILASIFALSRAAHGGRYVSRLLSILIMGVAFFGLQLFYGQALIDAARMGLIAFVGLYVGLVVGWGKGFAAITGRYNPAEKEFWPADKVGDFVYMMYGDAKAAGVAFLTVRSILFLPLFITLARYTGDYYGYLLSSLFALSMGVVYYLAGRSVEESKAVRLAEVVYFFIIGASLA